MAAPTFQAAGTPVEAGAGTGTISPAWPTHLTGDVALLIVESKEPVMLSVPAGFRELPSSPRFDRIGSTNYSRLTVFWCRATSAAMGAPSVWGFGHHKRAVILTFRGVTATGRPWDITAGNDTGGTGTNAVSVPGGTTTTADCLVVAIVNNNNGVSTPQVTGWANASLTGLTEILDTNSGGIGSGFAAAAGVKAAAGVVNATTASLVTNSPQGRIMVALSSAAQPAAPAGPYLHGIGEPKESASAAVSPAWPPHQADDIGLLIVESGGWPVTLSVAAGFTEADSSPQNAGVSGTTSSASLKVYWKRATGGAEATPTVNFIADHVNAQIITIRGAANSGNPWEASAGDATSSASTNVTWPGISTTKDNDLILNLLGHSADNDVMRHQNVANASLSSLIKVQDLPSVIGGGSGILIVTGRKDTAGTVDSTTATNNSSTHQGRITFGFKLPSSVTPHDKLTFNLSIKDANLLIGRRITAEPLAYALTLKNMGFTVGTGYVIAAQSMAFSSIMSGAVFRKRLGRWERKDAKEANVWSKRLPVEED